MNIRSIDYLSSQEVDSFQNNQKQPDREHLLPDGEVARFRRLLDPILFGTRHSSYGGDIDIKIYPSVKKGHSLFIHTGGNTQEIPMTIDNAVRGIHTIDMALNGYRFRVCEHILAVLYGYNIWGSEIHIEADSQDSSWPTERASVSEYARKIRENSGVIEEKPEFFTVSSPTKINFQNKHKSSILLIPDIQHRKKTIFDVNIDYNQSSIGGARRTVYERGDIKTFEHTISHARTNARGWRSALFRTPRFLGPLLTSIPKIGTEIPIGIERGAVMEIYKDRIGYPNEVFYTNSDSPAENWSELGYHEVQDKMGPHALGFSGDLKGRQFSGKIISYKASHEDDMSMFGALQDGTISTILIQ